MHSPNVFFRVTVACYSVANDRSSAKNLVKGSSEVAVKDGVNDGIQRRVAVAKPEEDRKQHLRYMQACQ